MMNFDYVPRHYSESEIEELMEQYVTTGAALEAVMAEHERLGVTSHQFDPEYQRLRHHAIDLDRLLSALGVGE